MIELPGDLTLLRPWWLAALPAAVALYAIGRRRAAAPGAWSRAIDAHLLAAMAALGRLKPGDARGLWPPLALAALLALALSGPAAPSRDQEALRNLDGMALLMDLSPSVPSAAATAAARILLDGAGARGTAAIVYAGDAYLAAPFTTDRAALARALGALHHDAVPDPGTAPARAIAMAAERFAAAGVVAGDAVLISDGGGAAEPAALEAARALRRSGARLHAVALAAEPGAPPADPAALAALAEAGGGETVGVRDAPRLAERLGGGFASRVAGTGWAALFWRDYGRAALGLALIPAFLMFRRRA